MAVITVDTKYPGDKVKLLTLSSRSGRGVGIGLKTTYPENYAEVYLSLSPEDARVLIAQIEVILALYSLDKTEA